MSGRFQESAMVWRRRDEGGWEGEAQIRPCLARILNEARDRMSEARSEFSSLFFARYPEYGRGKLVRCGGFAGMQISDSVVSRAIEYLWKKHPQLNVTEADVEQIVGDFSEFVTSTTIRVRFQAPLHNFRMRSAEVKLEDGLVLRRLTEQEVTALYYGYDGLTAPAMGIPLNEYVIEGEEVVRKLVGDVKSETPPAVEAVKSRLDRAILCLTTFKGGRVGYQSLLLGFKKFCPLNLGSYGFPAKHIPPGSYELDDDDLNRLPEHAKHIAKLSEPALVTACNRLGYAEARVRADDQILDAVIGMEAILLAAFKEDRSEMRFRFSLNYSTLFSGQTERVRAFKIAKGMYDLRSKIAHGGLLGENCDIGGEEVKPFQAAEKAREILRELIIRFLPLSDQHPFKKQAYWEEGYFRPEKLAND